MKTPSVYIMASKPNGTLYTGVTSDLLHRVQQHRCSVTPGFTTDYHCKLLVWHEPHTTMSAAITREKQIKSGSRRKKLALIESRNSDWQHLFQSFL